MAEKKVLFVINGFEVRENSTYIVKDKRDANGPDGIAKAGLTKIPGPGIGNRFAARFIADSEGSKEGSWDTGFYVHSPCYRGIPEAEAEIQVKALQDSIVKPYQRAKGNESLLDRNDDKFWDKFRFEVFTKKVFNTAEITQLLELYFALRTYHVAPKEKEKEHIYADTAYLIIDSTKDTKLKDEKASNLFKTIGLFMAMLQNEKPMLLLILNYMGLAVSEDVPDEVLNGMFKDFLDADEMRGNHFCKFVEESKKEEGKAKFDIYKRLRDSIGKGSKVTRTAGGVYFYDSVEIGPDLKTAADNIARQADLIEIKRELLLIDEN